MKIETTIISSLTALAAAVSSLSLQPVRAASGIETDASMTASKPYLQFYCSDEEEFFSDGIRVICDGEDVTDKSKIIFETTPASTYDGKNTSYVVPYKAVYEGVSCEGRLDARIGLRGDADCDGKVTEKDHLLILEELGQYYGSGRSILRGSDGFGIFLANADGRQTSRENEVYGSNDMNIADAYFISSYVNDTSKTLYENFIEKYMIRPGYGNIEVTSASGRPGDTVQLYISEKCGKKLGAFDITLGWDTPGLRPLRAYSMRDSLNISTAYTGNELHIFGYAKNNVVADGRIAVLQFEIPDSSDVGDEIAVSVKNVNYFGAGDNIASFVTTSGGTISVTKDSSLYGESYGDAMPQSMPYSSGVKAGDTSVEYGTASVKMPVMLLGGLKTKGMKLTYECDSHMSVAKLERAVSKSDDNGRLTAVYESSDGLEPCFEMVTINIAENTPPGYYPVTLKAETVDGVGSGKFIVIRGSVTVRDKSYVYGDANEDGTLNVRDAAMIAKLLASGKKSSIPPIADHNGDNKISIRDAASIAKSLAGK